MSKKPDFFIRQGDNSRKNIAIGMVVVGFLMMIVSFYSPS
jgi:hypothetical protein